MNSALAPCVWALADAMRTGKSELTAGALVAGGLYLGMYVV